jgi:hypothetical protein
MTDKKFCSNCGSEYDFNNIYCSKCGMSVESLASVAFKRRDQTHCTTCGSNTSPHDTYCAICGIECKDYIAVQKRQERKIISDILDAEGAQSLVGIADKIGTKISLSENLSQIKERSVFMPAFVFAVVAVGVGLILSFVIDLQIDWLLRDWLEDTFGRRTVEDVLDGSSFSLGVVPVWLLTCLGGLRFSISGSTYYGWRDSDSYSTDASLSLGFIWLIVVPIIALLIARNARQVFIASKHAGKEISTLDGLLGAGMFAAINLILSFFPTPLGNTINRLFTIDGDFLRLNVNVGPIIFNLLFFSFVIALVFSMPGWRRIAESLGRRFKVLGLSGTVAIRYVRFMLLAGLIWTVISWVVNLIVINSEIDAFGGDIFENIGSILGVGILALPNTAISQMAFLTGGSFSATISANLFAGMSGNIEIVSSAFGFQYSMPGFPGIHESYSWLGLLVLVAGLWIAVSTIYILLRNEKKLMINGLAAAGVSAVAMWAVSALATIALNFTYSGYGERMRGNVSIGTASFANLLICAVMMVAAVFVVFLARRYPSLDNFLDKAAKPGIAYIITALIAIVFTVVSTQSLISTIISIIMGIAPETGGSWNFY